MNTSSYTSLYDWLAHCEGLHSTAIDLGLERVAQVYQQLERPLKNSVPGAGPVIFTVAGTNGKGSTCAMLESILLCAGYRVGVYSSPHLVHFEERCRINGQSIAADELLPHFAAVEGARGAISLTYFEFTTLAIMQALSQAALDVVILEVGLGGRLDAVNVVDTDCAVITSIDIDHVEFLGPDRETIGREKAGILRANRPAIMSDPLPPASLLEVAQQVGADVWLNGRDYQLMGDRQQWSWRGRDGRRYAGLAYPALRGANQLVNAAGVLAALQAMQERLPISAQAIRQGLGRVELPGRFQMLPGQPMVILDVAHNPHATAVLAQNLDQMGFYPRTLAVFGAMKDKDVAQMVQPLLPLIDSWYCTDLPLERAATAQELKQSIEAAWAVAQQQQRLLPAQLAVHINMTPEQALHSALQDAQPTDRILVFGSFLTVGGVLQKGIPPRTAPHLLPAS